MQAARQTKTDLFTVVAQVAQAIANPHRLELLDLLVQAPGTVEQLATASAMSVANTSQHLQRLKRAGLVTSLRQGISIQYRLADPAIARLWVDPDATTPVQPVKAATKPQDVCQARPASVAVR